MAPPRLPPYLTPELVEEILLRVPPIDPACLVRASLACKPWRRLLCDPAFRRRYLAFHRRTPPLLGFFHNRWRATRRDGDDDDGVIVPSFVATTTPSPFPKRAFDGTWCVVDCRHGRVLLEASTTTTNRSLALVVWDPTTSKWNWLPKPPTHCWSYAAAVLCALHEHGCDHLECCSGPFFVVLVEPCYWRSVRVQLYSSEAGSWNTLPDVAAGFNVNSNNRSTLIGNDIYFVSASGSRDEILKYNLGNNHISFLQAPADSEGFFLVPMEDGLLGLGTISDSRICLWSRNVNPDVVAGARWLQCGAIDLQKLIPISTFFNMQVVGSADDFGIIFLATVEGVFTIDIKSSRMSKVGETMKCFKIFPFMAFYTPDSRLS